MPAALPPAGTPVSAIEVALPGLAVLRGQRWGSVAGPRVLFLHAPGRDLDEWGDLPALVAWTLPAMAIALDLPGHGLSDGDPEAAASPPTLASMPAALAFIPLPAGAPAGAANPLAVVASGATAGALLAAPPAAVQALVLVSPAATESVARSPRMPKLFLVGRAPGEPEQARRLARQAGGWAPVTVLPDLGDAGRLLGSGRALAVDHLLQFLRDVFGRKT